VLADPVLRGSKSKEAVSHFPLQDRRGGTKILFRVDLRGVRRGMASKSSGWLSGSLCPARARNCGTNRTRSLNGLMVSTASTMNGANWLHECSNCTLDLRNSLPYKQKKPLDFPVERLNLNKVGATRFERATSCSQSRRSSQAELRPDVCWFTLIVTSRFSQDTCFRKLVR
jgi:hypothetical protein